MNRRSALALLSASCFVAFGSGASATTMRHLDTRELTRDSQEIVVATVQSTRSYWNASRTKILTDVELAVSRSIKGEPPELLSLTQLGGEVGAVRYSIPGSPVFTPGQEALLFVWRDSRGRAQVNGLAQGKFDVRRDPVSGERLVQRMLPGLAVSDLRSLKLLPEGAPAPSLRLDDLLREIQKAMAESDR